MAKQLNPWLDEKVLLTALRQNNNSAFSYIYYKTLPEITRYVVGQHGSVADAEDLCHQAILILLKKLSTGFEQNAQITTYLFAIAQRQWWRMNSQRKNFIPYEPDPLYNENDDIDFDPLDDLPFTGPGEFDPDQLKSLFTNDLPDIETVLQYVKTMGPPCRDLLLDHYLGSMPFEEIAEETNQRSGTLRQQALRCRERVREYFSKNW